MVGAAGAGVRGGRGILYKGPVWAGTMARARRDSADTAMAVACSFLACPSLQHTSMYERFRMTPSKTRQVIVLAFAIPLLTYEALNYGDVRIALGGSHGAQGHGAAQRGSMRLGGGMV